MREPDVDRYGEPGDRYGEPWQTARTRRQLRGLDAYLARRSRGWQRAYRGSLLVVAALLILGLLAPLVQLVL